jgi:hypothetical protein
MTERVKIPVVEYGGSKWGALEFLQEKPRSDWAFIQVFQREV